MATLELTLAYLIRMVIPNREHFEEYGKNN